MTQVPANCKAWKYTATPNFDPGSIFSSVSASSSTDAWAVGRDDSNPVIGHWNGRGWFPSEFDDPGTQLYGVAAVASDDAWAAGVHFDFQSGAVTARILHWDGVSWSVFSAPTGGSDATLYAISASGPDDVWAVGSRNDRYLQGLTLHWDGVSWTEVRAVDVALGTVFYAVTALSDGDAWAVGYDIPTGFEFQPVAEHWDGNSWTVVDTPEIDGTDNALYGVSGTGPDDVWAVGPIDGGTPPIVEHWDGTTWSIMKAAGNPTRIYGLVAVVAIAPDDVWAVGQSVLLSGSPPYPAAEHWDGHRWSLTSMWVPESAMSGLFAVGASSSTDVWGVGYTIPADGAPLAEHAKGPCPA